MKIAQFNSHYPYPLQFSSSSRDDYFCAGGERVVEKLSKELAISGHEVRCFAASKNIQNEYHSQAGVDVHRFSSLFTLGSTNISPLLLVQPLRYDCDIVHAHYTTPPGLIAAYLYSKIRDIPLVVTHHGGENPPEREGLVRQLGIRLHQEYLLERIFGHAERVVCPSAGYIKESNLLQRDDVTVTTIPNGINVDMYAGCNTDTDAKQSLDLTDVSHVFLYLGSHINRKGPQVVLDAFVQLHERHPDTVLIMAGDGPVRGELETQAEREQIQDSVRFPGFVPEAEKPTYMVAADTFVFPTVDPASDMFPLTLLEAAAADTPSICSAFPTLEAIFEGYNCALFFEPGNVKALASQMEAAMNGTALANHDAERFAAAHRWTEIADQYLELYNEVIDQPT